MPDLVAWRADPAPARVHAGTVRADPDTAAFLEAYAALEDFVAARTR